MIDRSKLHILCPIHNRPLENVLYNARSTDITRRIHCTVKGCTIDTGRQCTLADAFQSLMYLYFDIKCDHEYQKGDTNEKLYLGKGSETE